MISLAQLFLVINFISPLVSRLVGRQQNFSLKFKLPKNDKTDDIKILTFHPSANRETLILAKFATIFTYFFLINLLILTLPTFFYFLASSNFSILSSFTFLL